MIQTPRPSLSLLRFVWIISAVLFLQGSVTAQVFTAKAGYLGQWAFAPGVMHRPTTSIYIPGAYAFGDIDQLARYNVTTNTWSTIPGLPAIKSEFGFCFTVNNRIFFGGGVDQPGTFSNVTREFVPPLAFSVVDNIPNGPASCFSFSLGNYGYVGGGMVTGFANLNLMYRFDPSALPGSQWTTVTAYPGLGDINSGAVSLGSYAYVGLGRSNPGSTEYNDFWRYDPSGGPGGTWTAMAAFPGGVRECPIMAAFCGKVILMGGWNAATNAYYQDIWEFDPAAGPTGTWTSLGTHVSVWGPQAGRYGPASAVYGDSLFFGMGYGVSNVNTDWNMFTYCPVILPSENISLDLQASGKGDVLVSWRAGTGAGVDHYILETSSNELQWETVTAMDPIAGSGTETEYVYEHLQPGLGLHYYRVRELNSNGNVRYSEVKHILLSGQQVDVWQLYPNPASGGEIFLQSVGTSDAQEYELTGIRGESLRTGWITSPQTHIDVSSLSAGMYLVRIKGEDGSCLRFVRQ